MRNRTLNKKKKGFRICFINNKIKLISFYKVTKIKQTYWKFSITYQ